MLETKGNQVAAAYIAAKRMKGRLKGKKE